MYTLPVQLFSFYSVFSCITCGVQDVFLTKVTPSSLVCDSLCTYTTRCASHSWDAATGSCQLHTGRDTGRNRWRRPLVQYQKALQTDICGARVCGTHQTCVPVEAGAAHICLGMTFKFNGPSTSAATPVTTAPPSTATSSTPTIPTTEALTTTTPPTSTPSVSSIAAITTTVPTTSTAVTTTSTAVRTTSTTVPTTSTTVPTTSTTVPTTSTTVPTTSTSVPTTTTATTTVSTTSTSTSSTTTTTPTTTMFYDCAVTSQAVSNNECGTYIGCYFDDADRVLPSGHLVLRATMTSERCMMNCYGSYTHFGVEDGSECFCGNEIKSGYAKKGDHECPSRCPGDSGTGCGGPWRISIYKIVP